MKKSSRYPKDSNSAKPGLDLSSLVDVSFLLLIYFIATSTLQPEESDLGLLMFPNGKTSLIELPSFEVALQADGSVVGNDEVLDVDVTNRDLPQLRERLRVYKSASDLLESTPEVSVSVDDSAHGQRFVDVLNCLASLEIDQVNLRMQPITN